MYTQAKASETVREYSSVSRLHRRKNGGLVELDDRQQLGLDDSCVRLDRAERDEQLADGLEVVPATVLVASNNCSSSSTATCQSQQGQPLGGRKGGCRLTHCHTESEEVRVGLEQLGHGGHVRGRFVANSASAHSSRDHAVLGYWPLIISKEVSNYG